MHQGLVAGDAADEEPAVGAIGQSRQVQPFQLGKIGADDLGLDGLAVPGLAQGQAGEIVGVLVESATSTTLRGTQESPVAAGSITRS